AALAAAVRPDRAVQEPGEAEYVGKLVDARGRGAPLHTPEASVDVEIAPAGQRAIDGAVLEDDAAGAPGGERIGRDVGAGDARAAARGPDRCRQHADGRRLAGAVGPEQPERLAGRDLEADAVYGLDSTRVGLAKIAHVDRWMVGHEVPPLWSGRHIDRCGFVNGVTDADEGT